MKNVFCPITFVNEKQEQNPDLNELFIAGYRDKVCTDYSISRTIDMIKETIDFQNPTEDQQAWLNDIQRADISAHVDAIMSYLVCQVTDLTYNTIILIAQLICDKNQSAINALIDNLVNKENLRAIIINILSPFQGAINRDDPDIAMFQTYNIMMSSVYSKVVATIFDPLVEKSIAFFAASDSLSTLYKYLFSLAYNEEAPEYTSYSEMYNLCATIIREAIDKYTLQYRQGLIVTAKNITIMSAYSPRYGKNVFNPKYITSEQEYLDTGLFTNNMLEDKHDEV